MEYSDTSNNQKSEIKLKSNLDNIKNDYFLQKVMNNLSKKETLEIIKYNKKIKERLNININDYKEYCKKYSSIEIELIPIKNKYGPFINIKEGDKLYSHIYFNDNKEEEIKRYELKENDIVHKINIIIDYQIVSFCGLFFGCECIESIYLKRFYRNNVNDMSGMFAKCPSLKEINLSNFNINNVTDMSGMFYECSSLKEINLSNFNTNNVTDMSNMFYECSALKEINLSNFNVNNVIYIRGMFFGCSDEIKMKIKEQIKNIKEEAYNN